MTAKEAKEISFRISKPAIDALNGYLKWVKEHALKGEWICWFNTAQPDMEALKMAKDKGFRVFIRKGSDYYGYPLYCLYWGDEENPIPNFNVGSLDREKIYEL